MSRWEDRLPAQDVQDIKWHARQRFDVDHDEQERQCEAATETAQASMGARLEAKRLCAQYGFSRREIECILPPGHDPQAMRKQQLKSYEPGDDLSDVDLPPDKPLEQILEEISERLCSEYEYTESHEGDGGPKGKMITDALPEALIKYLAWAMIQTCHDLRVSPPMALCTLLQKVLGTGGFGSNNWRVPYLWKAAAMMRAQDPTASARSIAKRLNISHTTVGRWLNEDPDFKLLVQCLAEEPEELVEWLQYYEHGMDLPDPPWCAKKDVRTTRS